MLIQPKITLKTKKSIQGIFVSCHDYFNSLLFRYLLSTFWQPFILSFSLFLALSISLSTGYKLIFEITKSGMSFNIWLALQYLILKIPALLVYILPLSLLLSTMLVYNRLNANNEIVAMQSLGINFVRLLCPILFVALIVSIIAYGINDYLVPWTNAQANQTLNIGTKLARPLMNRHDLLITNFQTQDVDQQKRETLSHLVYAKKFDGKHLFNATVIDASQDNVIQVFSAELATWDVQNNDWVFVNGDATVINLDNFETLHYLQFQRQTVNLPSLESLISLGNDSWLDRLNFMQLKKRLQNNINQLDQKFYRRQLVGLHKKLSLPFACLCLGLLGSIWGLKVKSEDNSFNLFVFIIFIFSYYLLGQMVESLAIQHLVSPAIAAWTPNIYGLAMAILVYSCSTFSVKALKQ